MTLAAYFQVSLLIRYGSNYTLQLNATPVRIPLRVLGSFLNINAHQHRDREPHHKHEEEKRVANVPRRVGDETHDQRANETGRLRLSLVWISWEKTKE
jgi:hypothetical protein